MNGVQYLLISFYLLLILWRVERIVTLLEKKPGKDQDPS
jgi:hypothetical protein